MGLYLLGGLAAVLAPNVGWLLAARLLQGIGASVGIATARAIVRDQFVGETSSRIMNNIGIMLAIGPVLAPTIGGFTMALAGWHAIFGVMVALGFGVIVVVLGCMQETTVPDPRLIRPPALVASYARIFTSRRFLATSLTLGGSTGALYTLATVLPFVLIDRAGLTPMQFGIGMLGQTGMFFLGSVVMKLFSGRIRADRLVAPGLVFIGIGGLGLIASIAMLPVSYASIMAPVGFYAFGIAFVMPAMTTAALAQFPDVAGAASATLGFVQMGIGLLGGVLCALIGAPVLATQLVIPSLAVMAIASYAISRRLPELATGPTVVAPSAELVLADR